MVNISQEKENIASKEFISGLILTCSTCDKYKDISVLFSVEKRLSELLNYYVILLFVLPVCLLFFSSNIFLILYIILLPIGFVFLLNRIVRKESVYLCVPIGLQLSANFLLGYKSNKFIPWSIIQDFLIVEVITRQTVIYCLIVLLEDTNGACYVTLFENTKPRIAILEKVYRKLQTILVKQKKRLE